jgi:TonB-linked SusC/RagA family outer membrane protein
MERDWKEIDAVDIESMSVLKDASATAVFGVRGANGVILITTKRGTTGRPTVRASYQTSFQQPIRLPHYLRSYDYAVLLNEALVNDRGEGSERYTPADLEHYRLGDSPYTHPDNDYYNDLLSKTALQHLANASVSGGTDFVKYYISGNYMTQEGLYRTIKNDNYPTNNRYTRASIRANLDFNITKTTRLGVDVTGRLETRNQPNNNSAIFDRIQKMAPNWQPYVNPDGSINNNTRDMFNPTLMMSKMGYRWNYNNVLETAFTLAQNLNFITDGLSFRFLGGFSSNYRSQRYINEEPYAFAYDKTGQYTGSLDRVETTYSVSKGAANRNTSGQASLNYTRDFGKHSVTGLLLYLIDQRWNGYDIPVSYLGWVGRATYAYDHRYLFELNAGYNGSTNFAKDKRFALFPAVSLGWVISEERFWKETVKSVDFLKIRGSYGEVGNDKIGDYKYFYEQTYYEKSGGDGDGTIYWGYAGATTSEKFKVEGTLANMNVTWERAQKANIGLDLRMFHSKLSFSGDFFYEKRVDILGIPYNIPLVLGMGNPTDANRGLPPHNINEVINKGFDFELGYDGKISDFRYYLKGNFTFARNHYTKINEQNVVYEWQSKKGRPLGQIFGKTDIGLYQKDDFVLDAQNSLQLVDGAPVLKDGFPIPAYGTVWPGDCKYLDMNGDGVIDQYDDGAIGKSKVPELSYGITVGGTFKGFDFNVLFQGSGGAGMPLREFAMWEFYSSSGDNGKVMEHHLGRYNPADESTWTSATYPRLHYGANANNHQMSTRWLFDRSYLRLKNIEIGYTLPAKWTIPAKLSSCRVFASGTNVFTWDKMMNWDPESSSETGTAYPQIRSWSVGLSVQF